MFSLPPICHGFGTRCGEPALSALPFSPVFLRSGRTGRPSIILDGAVSENTLSLNKTFVLFGVAVLGMIAFAILATMPTAGRLMAREQAPRSPCHTEQVPLDHGYGVSRFVERRICDDD